MSYEVKSARAKASSVIKAGDIGLVTYYEDAHCVVRFLKDMPNDFFVDNTDNYEAVRDLEANGYLEILRTVNIEFFGYYGTAQEGQNDTGGPHIATPIKALAEEEE